MTNVSIQASDYLEISYQGTLKSIGNPQRGRAIQLHLINANTNDAYQLRMQNSRVNGFPLNQFSFALATVGNTLGDLITSNFQPQYDQDYTIRAITPGRTMDAVCRWRGDGDIG